MNPEDSVDYALNYDPSEEKKHTISKVYDRLQSLAQMRNKVQPYFNGRGLTTYVDELMNRWNGILPPRSDLAMEGDSQIFNGFTRNVVLAFLSKAAMTPPRARFVASNKDGFQDTL